MDGTAIAPEYEYAAMKSYRDALQLLERASDIVEKTGDTLVVAHLALPIALLREKLCEEPKRDIG